MASVTDAASAVSVDSPTADAPDVASELVLNEAPELVSDEAPTSSVYFHDAQALACLAILARAKAPLFLYARVCRLLQKHAALFSQI